MIGSESYSTTDEPPTISSPIDGAGLHSQSVEQASSQANSNTGHDTSGEEECKPETDEFGLPIKKVQRRSASTLDYETASEEEGLASPGRDTSDTRLSPHPLPVAEGTNSGGGSNGRVPLTLAEVDGHGFESQHRDRLSSHGKIDESSETSHVNRCESAEKSDSNHMETSGGKSDESSPREQVQCVKTQDPDVSNEPKDDRKEDSQISTNSPALDHSAADSILHGHTGAASAWSHQALAPQKASIDEKREEDAWQSMPSYAQHDLYDDNGRLIAREAPDSDEEANAYHGLGGAGKGYTRVQVDEDARSATSMDENTDYLFKQKGTDLTVDDDEARDQLAQLQATKDLLTEGQRIAYVGVTRLTLSEMVKELEEMESTRKTKKQVSLAFESMKMWSQKMMIKLYAHMEINQSGKSNGFKGVQKRF